MRITVALIAAALLVTSPVWAQKAGIPSQSDTMPSDESVRHLLDVMQVKKSLEAVVGQMNAMFDNTLKKQLEGRSLTQEQQQAIETRQKAARSMIDDLLGWDSMEKLYLKVYKDTFSQTEIDGITQFYATPTGQAVIGKLPLAMKNSMLEMQQRVQEMMPKLQQLAQDAASDVKDQKAPNQSGE